MPTSKTFTSGEVLTAAMVNSHLTGGKILAYATATSDQGSITSSVVDLTGLSVTFTAEASRNILILANAAFSSTVADDTAELRIRSGVGSQAARGAVTMRKAGIGESTYAIAVVAPSAGTNTYKLSAIRVDGTGTLTSSATATAPAWIIAIDAGPVS